jgi:hypothetical protein
MYHIDSSMSTELVEGCLPTENVGDDQVASLPYSTDAPVFPTVFSPQQVGVVDIHPPEGDEFSLVDHHSAPRAQQTVFKVPNLPPKLTKKPGLVQDGVHYKRKLDHNEAGFRSRVPDQNKSTSATGTVPVSQPPLQEQYSSDNSNYQNKTKSRKRRNRGGRQMFQHNIQPLMTTNPTWVQSGLPFPPPPLGFQGIPPSVNYPYQQGFGGNAGFNPMYQPYPAYQPMQNNMYQQMVPNQPQQMVQNQPLSQQYQPQNQTDTNQPTYIQQVVDQPDENMGPVQPEQPGQQEERAPKGLSLGARILLRSIKNMPSQESQLMDSEVTSEVQHPTQAIPKVSSVNNPKPTTFTGPKPFIFGAKPQRVVQHTVRANKAASVGQVEISTANEIHSTPVNLRVEDANRGCNQGFQDPPSRASRDSRTSIITQTSTPLQHDVMSDRSDIVVGLSTPTQGASLLPLQSGLTPPRPVPGAGPRPSPPVSPDSNSEDSSKESSSSEFSVKKPVKAEESAWSNIVELVGKTFPIGSVTPPKKKARISDMSSSLPVRQRLPLFPQLQEALDFTQKEVEYSKPSSKAQEYGPLSQGKYPTADKKRDLFPPSSMSQFLAPSLEDVALNSMGKSGNLCRPTFIKLTPDSLRKLEKDQRAIVASLSNALWSTHTAEHLLKDIAAEHPDSEEAKTVLDLTSASKSWMLTVADRATVALSTFILMRRDSFLSGLDPLVDTDWASKMRAAPFTTPTLFGETATLASQALAKSREQALPTLAVKQIAKVAQQMVKPKPSTTAYKPPASSSARKPAAEKKSAFQAKPFQAPSNSNPRPNKGKKRGKKHKGSKPGNTNQA